MSELRRQVLRAFKRLHRTREFVFHGDQRALIEGRQKINESFRNNRNEAKNEEIRKMIKLAEDVEHELRTNVIQAKRREDNVYELRITPEITRLDNVVFNPDAIIESPRRRGSKTNTEGCCGGSAAMAALNSETKSQSNK